MAKSSRAPDLAWTEQALADLTKEFADAYGGRTALITGADGFMGSHLTDALCHVGADVHAFVRATSSGALNNIWHLHGKLKVHFADLTDKTSIDYLVRELDGTKPYIFHLAAEVGGIGVNRANPGRFWYANLIMGVHVLELARRDGVGKVVLAGTVCAYPKNTPVPFREEELWNGYPEETNAPYGVAKKSILVGAQAYREQYGTNAIFLLPTNLYGPRDNFDLETSHVIPALIRKMLESPDEIVLWGDGSPSREYLYVEDCVEGFVLAAERYDGPEPVNLGTGVETTIRETAELVAELVGFEGRVSWDTSMPNGQPRRSLDASRAKELFGFEASTTLRDGLERTIAWYRTQTPIHAAR